MKKEIKEEEEVKKGFYFDNSLNKFGRPKHDYYMDGRLMTGVTSVLGVIGGDKSANLIQWAADLAAVNALSKPQIEGIAEEYERMQYIKDYKEKKKAKDEFDEKYPDFKIARTSHLKKKDAAGDIGTTIHKHLENWIKQQIKFEMSELFFIPQEEIKIVNNFINWAIKNEVRFLESEKKLYSRNLFVAGTADFVCEIKGKKYVGDIKTGGIYDRIPAAQAAAYRFMLEEMNEKDFTGSVIVNIKKDGSFDEKKDVYWSTDYQEDLRLFMGALEVYRVISNTQIIKDNE